MLDEKQINEIISKAEILKYQYYSENQPQETKEQKQYMLYFQYFVDKLALISLWTKTLETFYTEDFKIFNKYSPASIRGIYEALVDSIIINLNAFFGKKEEMSFFKFKNYVEVNYKNIFTTKFYEIEINTTKNTQITRNITSSYEDILLSLKKCKIELNIKSHLINSLREIRTPKAHFTNNSINSKLSFDNIIELVKLIESVLNLINGHKENAYISFTHTSISDLDRTTTALNKYDKYKTAMNKLILEDKISNL